MDGLLGMKIKHHLFYRGGRVEEEEKNGDNNELLICFGGSSQVWPQTHSCHICKKEFTKLEALKSHKVDFHTHHCEKCNRSFALQIAISGYYPPILHDNHFV